jgi:formyl-CoA transferase
MNLPLDDIRVIDLTVARAGPTCVRQLADWGADVIRVDRPGAVETFSGGRHGSDFQHLHRNKRSLTLDLRSPDGREVLLRLADAADVLIENMRPPVKRRLGFDYDTLHARNPRLVYGSISGFGQDGPYGDRGGVDQIAQGMGGLMSVTGLPGTGPVRAGIPVSDLAAGLYLAIGVLVALHDGERTGTGRWVRTSLLEAMIAMMDFQAARWTVDREVPGQAGNDHPTIVPMGCFPTADGYVNIGAASGRLLSAFMTAIGLPRLPDDDRFDSPEKRSANRAERNHHRADADPADRGLGRRAERGRGAERPRLPDGRGLGRPPGRALGDDQHCPAPDDRPPGHRTERGADDRRAGYRPDTESRSRGACRRGARRTWLLSRADH